MSLPQNLRKKYLDQFDELVRKGEDILQGIKDIPYGGGIFGEERPRPWTQHETECHSRIQGWLINYNSLLDQIIPLNSTHRQLLIQEKPSWSYDGHLKNLVSRLKGLKDDFANGFLSDLSLQIEAEVAADYMGQAEQLLAEGQTGQYDHVPAAVLAGAVLEKGLRTLCDKQTPPIATTEGGKPLTMNPLIEKLKKAGLFNELKAKQLRAWADIRNAAAHGEFDNFARTDVESMIKGVNDFLATHMA